MRRTVVLTVALLGCVAASRQVSPQVPIFRTAIDLTTVTATVLDKNGALVTGLPRDAFDVSEDGEPQVITQFTNERVPVSLCVLLDVSDSMYGRRIQDARDAIEQFVGGLMDRGDEFSILAFNHQQQWLTRWTTRSGGGAEGDDAASAFRVDGDLRRHSGRASVDGQPQS